MALSSENTKLEKNYTSLVNKHFWKRHYREYGGLALKRCICLSVDVTNTEFDRENTKLVPNSRSAPSKKKGNNWPFTRKPSVNEHF